eukprot:7868831-Ditylum_brightwellii.AAC.1
MLFRGVDGSVDGGENHLKHLTYEVDCVVKKKKKQHVYDPNATENCCVKVVKEDGVDGAESHLSHFKHEVDCVIKQN